MGILFNFFNQGWVGAIIGIIGVLIAIYTYKSTKIGPRLVFQMNSLKIIGKNEITPDEITIFYKGIKVPRVIKTTFIIWNSGTKTIDGHNIVKSDPLRLEFKESEEIIGASILKSTKEVNQFEIMNDENKRNVLNIDFEYLDPNDGVTIEILHTDIMRYPEFKGTIKGMPDGVVNWGNKSSRSNNNKSSLIGKIMKSFFNFISINLRQFLWLMLIIGVGLTAFSIIVPNYFESFAQEIIIAFDNENSIFSSFLIVGITYSVLPFINIWTTRKRYPKLLVVEKLEGDSYKAKTPQKNSTKQI